MNVHRLTARRRSECIQLLVPTPSTLRDLGFQCASPGFRDSPAEPIDRCQGLLELFNPEIWTTQVSRVLPLNLLKQRGSDRAVHQLFGFVCL